MTTTVGTRKVLDLKRWEFCTPAPTATVAGSFIIPCRHVIQEPLYVVSTTVHYLYNAVEDGWVQIPSGALAGTFGAGSCGCLSAIGPSGTATAGSTTTLTTNLTIATDLRGFSIHITGGPGAGDVKVIASNTIGANSVITIASTFSATITSSSTYRLITPRYFVLSAGTLAAGSFRYYDYALNTWTTLANTGLPATIGTDGCLIATPSWVDSGFVSFATGTATAGAATTLTNGAKTWTVNQWSNYQVRITGGTGIGQIRTISSNTATVLTVSASWTTNPDATSVYSIEGNDDSIYFLGNNAVTLYKYSISGNTTSTLSPGVARAGTTLTGTSGHWVWECPDSIWTNESAIINGRRIYSFRGGGGSTLDYYDIALNTWVSGVTYAPATETFTTGTKYSYNGDGLYIQKDATGRMFRFKFSTSEMDGWNTILYPNGAAVLGTTAFDATYTDGATKIVYIYILLNTSTVLLRQMII